MNLFVFFWHAANSLKPSLLYNEMGMLIGFISLGDCED